MLIAFLSDIHANREAYEATIEAATELGAERFVILGDIVGYGPDPEWCVEKTAELQQLGATVIRGNHDQACRDASQTMNEVARLSLEWTRNQLSRHAQAYLAELPMSVREDDRLYIHSEASDPSRWRYVLSPEEADRHFAACGVGLSLCGHTHKPQLYSKGSTGKISAFQPRSADPIPLPSQRQWLAVLGSVGQPRDGNPKAAFALYDTETRELRFERVAYDIDKTVAKLTAAGLPEILAQRLSAGR